MNNTAFELFEKGKAFYYMKDGGILEYIDIVTTEENKQNILDKHKDSHIFYSLAIGKESISKKYKAEDIQSLDIVFIDIDRNYEENIEETKQILEKYKLNEYVSIFKSGTGYWLLFKLGKPCTTEEEFEKWKKVICILINLFDSDKDVKNIDRICRVSGSINHKDEAKGFKTEFVKVSSKPISLDELYEQIKSSEPEKLDTKIQKVSEKKQSYSETFFAKVIELININKSISSDEIFKKLEELSKQDERLKSYIDRKTKDHCKKDVKRIKTKYTCQKLHQRSYSDRVFVIEFIIGQESLYYNSDTKRPEINLSNSGFKPLGEMEEREVEMIAHKSLLSGKLDEWKVVNFSEALKNVAIHRKISPIKEYLLSLKEKYKYEDVKDLKHSDYITPAQGVSTQFLEEYMDFFLECAVQRGLCPGCKTDFIFIFYGQKGSGKTEFMKVLGGKFYSTNTRATVKEMVELAIGSWITNFDEFKKSKFADHGHFKSFSGNTEDSVRLSYRKDSETFIKNYILTGTTDHKKFLEEQDRRYLVLNVLKVDWKKFSFKREKYIAKAVWNLDIKSDWKNGGSELKSKFETIARDNYHNYHRGTEKESLLKQTIEGHFAKDAQILLSDLKKQYNKDHNQNLGQYKEEMILMNYQEKYLKQDGRTVRCWNKLKD